MINNITFTRPLTEFEESLFKMRAENKNMRAEIEELRGEIERLQKLVDSTSKAKNNLMLKEMLQGKK